MKSLATGAFVSRLAVVCLIILSAPVGVSASGVTVVDLGDFGGGQSFASFINLEGDVAGYSYVNSNYYHAFFYSGITMTIHDIGTFGGSLSQPNGLNASGEVSGTADLTVNTNSFVSNAFIYQDGVLTDLGTLGGYSLGYGLNDEGTVVGSGFFAGNTKSDAILSGSPYPPPPQDLGTLGGSFGEADFINDNGQIAGNANTSGDHGVQAFYSLNGTSLVPLTLGGASSTSYGINSSGQVIGRSSLPTGNKQHGFIYTPGAPNTLDDPNPHDLGTLVTNNAGASDAEAINNSGEVVGQSDYATTPGVPSGHHHAYSAMFVNTAWTMTDLGSLPGYRDSTAVAVNNLGEIVGFAGNGITTEAFLYLNGQMIDLTRLLPANSGFTQLLTATGINDNGVIIGQGITTTGATDAYILTYSAAALPEPSTMMSMMLGFLFGGAVLSMQRNRGAGTRVSRAETHLSACSVINVSK
jgi:probable HAF family extracellular repeat protein